jgi:hypothetical protein
VKILYDHGYSFCKIQGNIYIYSNLISIDHDNYIKVAWNPSKVKVLYAFSYKFNVLKEKYFISKFPTLLFVIPKYQH